MQDMPQFISILNLNSTHPEAEELLLQNEFSVSRSDAPSSRNAVDITIEQSINKYAKSHGGIVGFSRNYSAYFRRCLIGEQAMLKVHLKWLIW